MKYIFSLFVFLCATPTFGQTNNNYLLHFDGYYQTKCYIEKGDDEGSQDYLRFYASGKVITVGTDCEGTVNELKEWFIINSEQVGKGDYKIKRKKIFFSSESKTGVVNYIGLIKRNGII